MVVMMTTAMTTIMKTSACAACSLTARQQGEPGNGIVAEVAPVEGEKLIHKPGKGTFYGTDVHEYLQEKGVTHLLVAGTYATESGLIIRVSGPQVSSLVWSAT